MKFITITSARARRSPGLAGKEPSDVLRIIDSGVELEATGEFVEADCLKWHRVKIHDGYAWVAESTPTGTRIIQEIDEDESEFDKAFRFILKWEGGYVNDPRDPGGETNMGISRRAYPNLDIAGLTVDQAKEIYRQDYWVASMASAMPWPLNVIHFDAAVNCGIAQANRFRTAADNQPYAYIEYRRQFYRNISRFDTFGAGWMRRIDDLVEFVGM